MLFGFVIVCLLFFVVIDGILLFIKKFCLLFCFLIDVCFLLIDLFIVYLLFLGFILRMFLYFLGCGNVWLFFLGYKGILLLLFDVMM